VQGVDSTGASSTFELSLAEVSLLELVEPPASFLDVAVHLQGPRSVRREEPGPVQVRFESPASPGSPTVVRDGELRAALADDGRFFLADGRGRLAELPVDGGEAALEVDPGLDPELIPWYLCELVRWRACGRGAVMLHAAAAALPEGGVVLCGGEGIGKTSSVLALLEHATAFLADDRTMLSAPATVAPLGFDLKLTLGRRYPLARPTARTGLPWRPRVLVRRLPAARRWSPRLVRSWLDRRYDGYVGFDVEAAFPGLARPDTASVRAVVFLEHGDDGTVGLEPLTAAELVARAGESVRYWHDVFDAPCRRIFDEAGGRSGNLAFAVLDESLAALPGLLAGVGGWVLRVGDRAGPSDLATAVRRALTSPPASA
jgi:hypothetical protein